MDFWSSGLVYKIVGVFVLLLLIGLTSANIFYLNAVIRGNCSAISISNARGIRNFNIVILVFTVIVLVGLIISLFLPLGVSAPTRNRIAQSSPSNFAEFKEVVYSNP